MNNKVNDNIVKVVVATDKVEQEMINEAHTVAGNSKKIIHDVKTGVHGIIKKIKKDTTK